MVGAGEGGRAGGSGAGVGGGQPFVDRSKVRILLCDSDPDSSRDVLRLLCNCSYQVTCAKSPRQVINVLNCEGAEIDIILAEVDLPVSKCFKLLKYIGRNKELRHIPIIMMSNRDEVSVVVKCLRLGAAEYLVKPLRMNELLNLWTHVWRRRRMLGLAEKNFFIDNLELVLSEPSDANTNSTTLLSDETDDKPKGNRNHETNTSSQHEYESPAVDPPKTDQLENLPSIAEDDDKASSPGGMFSRPIKTNLRIAESSAFLAYVKSSTPANNPLDNELQREGNQIDVMDHQGNFSGATDRIDTNGKINIQDEKAFETPMQYPLVCFSSSNLHLEQRNEGQQDVSGNPPVYHYPFYYPGMVEHGMTLHSVQSFQGNINTAQAHTPPTMLHQYNVYHQSHGASMQSYQYSPAGMNVHSSHLSTQNVWSSVSSTPIPEERHSRSGRRAAALAKFRQKRKDRCFDKKVRYVNRKKVAETRPRVRGQFVRQASNTDIISTGDDISEYEDDDPSSRDVELVSSPE